MLTHKHRPLGSPLISAFFVIFSRTIQTSNSGLAPESCYDHRAARRNQDEDLSVMKVTIQRVTLQTASNPLY